MNKTIKNYREKMEDYKRFAIVLLCLGVFSYMGLLITIVQGTGEAVLLTGMTALLTAGAGLFFSLSAAYRKKVMEEDTSS